jgi:hypothetical protein
MQQSENAPRKHLDADDKKRLSIYESLMKRMLFACEYCNGALIQAAMCRFCKITTLRSCKDCSVEFVITHKHCIPKNYQNSGFGSMGVVRLD